MVKMLYAVTLTLCVLYGVQATPPVQTCQQLADRMRTGLAVDPGLSITDNQVADLGLTGGSTTPGYWQVNWYNGHSGTYRMGANKKYDLFPAGLGCRREASQLDLEPADICCTAACTHIIISGSDVDQTARMTHYTMTHEVHSGRPVYASDSRADFLYYRGEYNMWMVGESVGGNDAGLYVIDSALSPELIQGIWRVATADGVAVSFPSVKASCAECRQISISGSMHFQENRMTTYSLTNQIISDRPVYSSDTTSDFLYFYEPYDIWMVGNTAGGSSGGISTNDIHLYPEQVEAVWKIYDGTQWVPFPRVRPRCIDVDDCASGPCLNGGVCTDQYNSYSCSCAVGWGGDNCELSQQVGCASSPCQHGGVCTDLPGDAHSCDCMAGWEGNDCESDKNECDTVICPSGYQCVNHPGYYACLPQGLNLGRGRDFQSVCSPESCSHGWACEARGRGFACIPNQ